LKEMWRRTGGTLSDQGVLEFSGTNTSQEFIGSSLCVVGDWDADAHNLTEEQHRKLNPLTSRGRSDPRAKPNLTEKDELDKIINAVGNQLSIEEKDKLYRFRFALTENRKALTKLLLSIDWDVEAETADVPVLLNMWKDTAPIEKADALKLLGKEKAFQSPLVREYAVEILRTASDDELQTFLLQLVQALRYEPGAAGGDNASPSSSAPSPPLASPSSPSTSSASTTLSPLASFLVERACLSINVANSLYWFLKVETETSDETSRNLFESILTGYKQCLATSGAHGASLKIQMETLDEYISKISQCQRDARAAGNQTFRGKKLAVHDMLNRLLTDRGLNKIKSPTGLHCPLDPRVRLLSLDKCSKMFTSALFPCVIDFMAINSSSIGGGGGGGGSYKIGGEQQQQQQQSSGEEVGPNIEGDLVAAAASGSVVGAAPFVQKLFFKCGDDLRQDQLIMRLFELMDSLLKKVNLDLKMRTYGILATGQKDGLMEFCAGSCPISFIEKEYSGSQEQSPITAFLKEKNPDPSERMGIRAEAMDNFVKSFAGSCVMTYILGIGDRHLDNIMLQNNGQLFHIDFGFVFGKDPKPFPSPFRVTKSMVMALGGAESELFRSFRQYCFQAYNELRRSSNVILNLLSLMGDSGIPGIDSMGIFSILDFVEQRFQPQLTDEQADAHFANLIEGSYSAFAPQIAEWFHRRAVEIKNI